MCVCGYLYQSDSFVVFDLLLQNTMLSIDLLERARKPTCGTLQATCNLSLTPVHVVGHEVKPLVRKHSIHGVDLAAAAVEDIPTPKVDVPEHVFHLRRTTGTKQF